VRPRARGGSTMRLFNREVFRATVYGTAEVFTASEFTALLGAADKLTLHVRAGRVSGTSPKLAVHLYHSDDGEDWVLKGLVLSTGVLSATADNSYIASDDGTTPTAKHVRFGIALSVSDGVADVAINACGRGEARSLAANAHAERACGCAGASCGCGTAPCA